MPLPTQAAPDPPRLAIVDGSRGGTWRRYDAWVDRRVARGARDEG